MGIKIFLRSTFYLMDMYKQYQTTMIRMHNKSIEYLRNQSFFWIEYRIEKNSSEIGRLIILFRYCSDGTNLNVDIWSNQKCQKGRFVSRSIVNNLFIKWHYKDVPERTLYSKINPIILAAQNYELLSVNTNT